MGERKVSGLLGHGATVRVVSSDLAPRLRKWAESGRIEWIEGLYAPALLDGVDFIFAATDDGPVNRAVASDARERGLWCNMAGDPELGNFIVPSVVRRGPLTLAVGTTGASPAVAKMIREKLETEFGPEWGFFLKLLGGIRASVLARGLAGGENRRIFKALAALPVPAWIGSDEPDQAFAAICAVCLPTLDLQELTDIWEKAWNLSFSSSLHSVI